MPLDDFEPELRGPVPRLAKTTATSRLSIWSLFLGSTLLAAILLPWGLALERDFEALKTRGVETHGTVIERKPGGHKTSPSARFRYYAGNTAYTFRRSVSYAQYAHSAVGHWADITYLADRPQVAELSIKLEAHRYSDNAASLAVIGILAAIVGIPAWLCQLLQQHKALRLARFGRPSRTTRLEATLVFQKTRGGGEVPRHWRVRYEFRADGAWLSNQGKIPYEPAADWCAPGAQATVLYDPSDPAVNQLYPAIKARCTLPASAT